ncbi:AAA family ATPase [Gemmatimonadota bacterium]
MQIICISRGTAAGGQELAERLAAKMDYSCLSREDLIEAATTEGIPVGKLEMAMLKPNRFTERLALERDRYLAFSRAFLCQRASEGNLVYHGRTGHMLLLGVNHVLRVRVVSGQEHRVRTVMTRLGLEREKALRYVAEVDEDRRTWVRDLYGVSVDEAINYDVTVNLEQMNVENAASALITMAHLPDFQTTPASMKAMQDLQLGAEARLALFKDEQTRSADLKVRADSGIVTVSYRPQDTGVADAIPRILDTISGISDLRVTMATTNLLWIQEEFLTDSEDFRNVVEVATRWNSAVELIRLTPGTTEQDQNGPVVIEAGSDRGPDEFNGGIEDDEPESKVEDGGLEQTLDELARKGRSGGGRTIFGSQRRLVETLDRTVPYTLVVIGDVFLSLGHSARIRATRDFRSYLSDRIKAPVVTADELGSQYLFQPRDALRASLYLVLVGLLFFLVFTHQEEVLAFLANTGWYAEAVKGTFLARTTWLPKIIISAVVVLIIPVVAYSYGRVASAVLKLIKME